MNEVKLGNKLVGKNHEPYFIADIAANHDGSLVRAFRLIELAKESGADAAKFQNFKASKIVSDTGFKNLGSQVSHQSQWKKSVFETYSDASIPDDWTPQLKAKCNEVGIEYMTSPYDFDSVDWANKFVRFFKIGSGDISWPEMLAYIASKNKPVCLATGAASLSEVDRAVKTITAINPALVLMQCNTNYTADPENFKYINLNVLQTYANRYSDIVLGLSDHTKGMTTVLGSIALGARVIEKHFTDDDSREGPDHRFATTPSEWRSMVDEARKLFYSLGDGVKRIEDNEQQTSIVQKRSLYVVNDRSKGDLVEEGDIEPLRPRHDDGFEPWEIELVLGKAFTKSVVKGALLKRGDVAL